MNMNEKAFQQIEKMVGGFGNLSTDGAHMKLKSGGFMDLSVERLRTVKVGFIIAMAHYFEQNGDLVSDPGMEIYISETFKAAYAMTIQHSTGHYSVGMKFQDGQFLKAPRVQKDIQSFLGQWLRNLKAQGFFKKAVAA